MPDQEIFTDGTQTSTPATPDNHSNPFADQLSQIKNDKGEQKYKSVDDALSALVHAQQHIATIESERQTDKSKISQLEGELSTRQSVEDVVKSLTQTPEPAPAPTMAPVEDKGLNEDKVLELVKQALTQDQQSQMVQSNVNSVVSKLSETYGDKTQEVVASRAKELGMKPSALQELAGNNPQLVLSLFSDVKVESVAPTKSSTIAPTTPKETNERPTTDLKIISGGATQEEVMDVWGKAKEYTYKNLGVET